MTPADEVDVLVIGAGPAGVTAALLLARAGVEVLCVDKRPAVSSEPRARGVHARATEILRACGVEDDMRAHQLRIQPWIEVRPTLALPPVHTTPTGGDGFAAISPCHGIAISQDAFETVLRSHLDRADPSALRVGVEVVRLARDGGDVVAEMLDRGGRQIHRVTARFAIAADGWRSPIRTALGIALEGPDELGTFRAIRFRADLTEWLDRYPPALVRLAACEGVLLASHSDDRWMLNLPDGFGPPDPAETARAALGVDVAVEVITESHWTAAAQTADRLAEGPVFLLGDAAHRVPPAGATGITSAMADAHNLAWKIAAVLRGWAGEPLLQTYAVERRSVALRCTAAALTLWNSFGSNGAQPGPDLRALDMGYVYDSAAVIDAGRQQPVEFEYRPTAEPGARAPHVWIGEGQHRRSILDLFGAGFALLTGPAGGTWISAASRAGASTRIPVQATTLDEPEFSEAYALSSGDAVVVRPDGHVAWRSGPVDAAADEQSATKTLTSVLLQLTGRAQAAAAVA